MSRRLLRVFVLGAALLLGGSSPAAAMSDDINCLARTIYGEARGESEIGQALVALVVINRVSDKRWPNTVCGVVKQKYQFDGYWRVPAKPGDTKAWQAAVVVARTALAGRYGFGACGTATHFHEASVTPAWSRKILRLCRVDSHIFYKEKPRQ